MVTEAVGEMKGEPLKEPSELKLDVPTDAYLPTDYVTKEESRWRRTVAWPRSPPRQRSTTSGPNGRTDTGLSDAAARC
jgi:hypothetical protein